MTDAYTQKTVVFMTAKCEVAEVRSFDRSVCLRRESPRATVALFILILSTDIRFYYSTISHDLYRFRFRFIVIFTHMLDNSARYEMSSRTDLGATKH